MSFQLVRKSVTLNDPEWRNSRNHCIISPNWAAFGMDYVKVLEDTPILSVAEIYRPQNLVLVIYHLQRYWQRSPLASVKMRYSPLASEN